MRTLWLIIIVSLLAVFVLPWWMTIAGYAGCAFFGLAEIAYYRHQRMEQAKEWERNGEND